MENPNYLPQLRFRDFPEPWVEITLKDVFSNFRKKGDSSLPVYSVSQSLGMIPRETLERTIQQDAKPEQNLRAEPGDITYNMMRMWQGAYGVATTTCMISPAYVVLKPRNNVSSLFFKYQFGRKRSLYLFGAYSHGLTKDRLRLYYNDFSSIKAVIPSFVEQQKIASFLTSVDERIELLERKKEKLEVYKKGVMQQIFSQQIRFKQEDGSEFPDWEEKRLGEVVKVQGGFAFKSEKFKQTGIPVIRISNISNNNNFIETENLVFYDTIKNDVNFTINKGDLLIAMSGATTGKSSIYDLNDKAYLNQRVGLFKRKSKSLCYAFLIQFVFSTMFKNQLKSLLVAGAQPNISSSDIERIKISLPEFEEQEKIAAFLNTIDQNLETLDSQIQGLRTWKKGLLQQMFV